MNQIEENLKTARSTHQMLILICATILSLILAQLASQQDEVDYSGAVNELDMICKIDLNKFIENSLQKVEALGSGSDLGSVYPKAFDYAMEHEIEKAGFKAPKTYGAHEVFFTTFDEKRVRDLQNTGSVKEYRDFLSDNIGITFVFVQPEILAASLVEKIKDANVPTGSQIKGIKLVMTRPVYQQSGSNHFLIKAILLYSVEEPNIASALVVVNNPPVAMTSTYDETRFQNWLERDGHLSSLVNLSHSEPPYKTKSIFPHLLPVLSLVEDKTPEDAKRILSDKYKESQRKIAFFGIEINESMVVIAAPLLIFFILFYLWCHVLHIRHICKYKLEGLCIFPWLPLFVDKRAMVLSTILLPVLPVLTLCLLLWRFWGINGWPWCVLLTMTILSVLLSLGCWHTILSLRKLVLSSIKGKES